MTPQGRVYLGEKEIRGIWADLQTLIFPLKSNYNNTPTAYKIEELYKAAFYTDMPHRIKSSHKEVVKVPAYRRITLEDAQGEKLSFPNIEYVMGFLGASEMNVARHIKNGTPLKGFKMTGR
jgi:hypothetical protein